jgi:hypothetical protein
MENVIKEVAKEMVSKKGNQRNREWFEEECAKIISEKNSARKRMLQRETRANCERYQELRRKANRIYKKERRRIGKHK